MIPKDVFSKEYVHIQHIDKDGARYAWDLSDVEIGYYGKTIRAFGGKINEKNRLLPESRQSRINRI